MNPTLQAANYQPSSPQEKIDGISLLLPVKSRNGFVFLVANIKKRSTDSELLLQFLNDQIHRLADSFGKEANAQHRFEQFLGALNENISQQVRDGKWKVQIDEFDAMIGIACETQMYLSGTGELTALFLHKKPSQRYQIFNLFRGIQTEQNLPTWEKTFAVILDGDLHGGDVFCISNKNLQQEIQNEELNSILTTLPPKGAAEKIRQYFSEKENVLILIIKSETDKSVEKNKQAKILSDVSIDKLTKSEEKTTELLSEKKPKIGKIIIWILEKIFSKQPASRILKDLRKGESKWKIALHATQILGRTGIKYTKNISKKTLKKGGQLAKKENRKVAINKVMKEGSNISNRIFNLKNKLFGLPKSTKYLTIGVIIIVITLAFSVSLLSKAQVKNKEQKAYDDALNKVEDVIERAAGAIIYKDENQARTLYINALSLIDKLPSDSVERSKKISDLKIDIRNATDEIRHMVTIPNPALITDLALLNDGLFVNSFTNLEKELYVHASDGKLYKFNRTQKLFKAVSLKLEKIDTQIISSSSNNNFVYAIDENGDMYSHDIESLAQEKINLETIIKGTDIVAYANRLYLLSPAENEEGQIYRYSASGSIFSKPQPWIKAKTTNLNNATSLAIDGTIFVLKKSGQIIRYISGSEVGWSAGIVDPPITSATNIWTDTESNYVYVMEPSTKRIIIFEKETGNFVVQYKSTAFSEMVNFVVDESNYTIYIMSGSKLYSIAASHLK